MSELYLPQASDWINALEAGQRAGMTQRRNVAVTQAGGMMSSGDYAGAARSLFGAGDFVGGATVQKVGHEQTEQAQKLTRQQDVQAKLAAGDFSGAYAAAGTDSDLLEGLDKVAAHAKETTTTMASALQALKDPQGRWLQPDQARAKYQQIKPVLLQRGLDPKQVDSFDPTPEALEAVQSSVLGLKEQLDRRKPVQVGNNLVDPSTGRPVYQGVEYKTVKNGDQSESIVAVGGVDGPSVQASGQPAPAPSPAPAAAGGGDLPRGLRNNNPLNVSVLPHGAWDGQTGDDGRYATFGTPEAGWAAADKNLQSYGRLHGINTVAGIINRWSPPNENDTASYVGTVSQALGVKPDQVIDLTDPGVRRKVLTAMAGVENGQPVEFGAGHAKPTDAPSATAAAKSSGPGAKVIYRGEAAPDEGDLSDDTVEVLAGRYLKDGTLPPLGMGKSAAAARQKILNRASAKMKELGLDAGDLVAGTADVKATAAALSKSSQQLSQVESFEQTAQKNADLMLRLAPKGGGQTNIPVVNRWLQAGRKQVAGDPDVSNFEIALGTFADEYAKIVSGATGSQGSTDASRREAYDRLSKYATQGQLEGGISTMKQEMANRIGSMRDVQDGLRAHLHGGGQPAATAPAGRPPLAAFGTR